MVPLIYVIIRKNLFIDASLYLILFPNQIIQMICINGWTIMHLIHIFWNLNIPIMTMLSLSKVSFFLCRFKAVKFYFNIWSTNALFVCNMVKHALSIIWRAIIIIKIKGHDYILYLFCAKWDNNAKLSKMSESELEKCKHNILSF
jgi:hypothetical protein